MKRMMEKKKERKLFKETMKEKKKERKLFKEKNMKNVESERPSK